MKFEKLLKDELIKNASNYYTDNYDYYSHPPVLPIKKKLINFGKRVLYIKPIFKILFKSEFIYKKLFLEKLYQLDGYLGPLDSFYSKLENEESKDLLVKIIAFRILGYVKVKLPYHTPGYWKELKALDLNKNKNDFIELNFKPWKLYYHDLNKFGHDIRLYLTTLNAYSSILREHYYYGKFQEINIGAEEGDVVFDLGGCYGDTALYFAEKVKPDGRVFSFEFIPGSIKVFNKNLNLNKHLKPYISIVNKPLWETSGKKVYFIDRGGSSKVSFHNFPECEGESITTTIDNFVNENDIQKLDFIKTDIEGAEPHVLKGAERTLRKFKPKLAISIYHNMDDFVNIIDQIDQLNLGYKFYLGHASIFASETVLFCKTGENQSN